MDLDYLERKSRRQMRASTHSNCSSSIFRAAFPSPEDLDLEKRCRITRSFDANKRFEADTINAPIFIKMRYGNNDDLIGRFDDWLDGYIFLASQSIVY